MGRTNQVLTGGSIFSTSPQTTTMKIVLALVVLCLFQFSLAEQKDVDNAETNLVLKGCQGGWQEMRQWRQKVQKETEQKEEQEEREKRRQKEVWKRKKTETEERKENRKEAESKKEGKESKKAKVHEKTGWSNISI